MCRRRGDESCFVLFKIYCYSSVLCDFMVVLSYGGGGGGGMFMCIGCWVLESVVIKLVRFCVWNVGGAAAGGGGGGIFRRVWGGVSGVICVEGGGGGGIFMNCVGGVLGVYLFLLMCFLMCVFFD